MEDKYYILGAGLAMGTLDFIIEGDPAKAIETGIFGSLGTLAAGYIGINCINDEGSRTTDEIILSSSILCGCTGIIFDPNLATAYLTPAVSGITTAFLIDSLRKKD